MASKASAVWTGSLKEGKGTISTATGVLNNANYSFATRFEGADSGTTPEELIAAAHASCFSMALGAQLGGAGLTPTKIETHAAVTLAKTDAGFAITQDRADHHGQRSRRDQGSLRQGRGRRQGRLPDLEALRQQHRDHAGREAGVSAERMRRPGRKSRPVFAARKFDTAEPHLRDSELLPARRIPPEQSPVPKWRNWQTRVVQVHVLARVWGFESLLRHQKSQRLLIQVGLQRVEKAS